MAITRAEIDALKAKMMRGILEAEFDGQRVRFQDVASMQSAIAAGEAELAGSATETSAPLQSVIEFAKD